MRRPSAISAFLAGILLAASANAQENLRGQVTVVDGDSLRLDSVLVRLHGVDAPELEQTCFDEDSRKYECGRSATSVIRMFAEGKQAECRPMAESGSHVVARCIVGGYDVGQVMVRSGWALAKLPDDNYLSDEEIARGNRWGMWSGEFQPPWEWKRRN